jgi:hypothetical protein
MMDRGTIGGVSARLTLAVGAFDAAMPVGKSGRKKPAVSAGRQRQPRKTA